VPFINGLYHTGHWTFPGAFVQSVIFSGKYAAELILKNK
jgi:phytoene dehydrogenase-like protein